jgi:GT2 family glycosyltransferase
MDHVILVMNPDVAPEKSALTNALRKLYSGQRVGFVCPRISDWLGTRESVGHKRYPSLAVLAARFFRKSLSLRYFADLNAKYEYSDMSISEAHPEVRLCSGCFMLARRELWRETSGFDPLFFMYFEDFDLSLRAFHRGWRHVTYRRWLLSMPVEMQVGRIRCTEKCL